MASIVNGGHLIKKVYFPREALPLSLVLSNLINFLISLPVFFILAYISGVRLLGGFYCSPSPSLSRSSSSLGMALILSTLEVFYRDTHMVMNAVIQAWFLPHAHHLSGGFALPGVRIHGTIGQNLALSAQSDGVHHQHLPGHSL